MNVLVKLLIRRIFNQRISSPVKVLMSLNSRCRATQNCPLTRDKNYHFFREGHNRQKYFILHPITNSRICKKKFKKKLLTVHVNTEKIFIVLNLPEDLKHTDKLVVYGFY